MACCSSPDGVDRFGHCPKPTSCGCITLPHCSCTCSSPRLRVSTLLCHWSSCTPCCPNTCYSQLMSDAIHNLSNTLSVFSFNQFSSLLQIHASPSASTASCCRMFALDRSARLPRSWFWVTKTLHSGWLFSSKT